MIYDIAKEFNIKMPYTFTIKNPVMPITNNEPYFMFGKVRIERKEITGEGWIDFIENVQPYFKVYIRKQLKDATIYAINQEIKRYEQRKDKEKIDYLKKELQKIKKIKDEDFPTPENAQKSDTELISNVGPIVPCKIKKVEIIPDKEYSRRHP